MDNLNDELLTLEELAIILKVKPSWIYARTCKGQSDIPHVKLGRHLRFQKRKVFEALGIIGGT
jgi:predicted DNA-binding transcriptional regulator AlpA